MSPKFREALKIPIVIVAVLGGWTLGAQAMRLFGGGFGAEQSTEWLYIFPVGICLIAGYVAGNAMEHSGLSSAMDRITDSLQTVIWLVFVIALTGGGGALVVYLYRNMPLWAFVIAILLGIICILLVRIASAVSKSRE